MPVCVFRFVQFWRVFTQIKIDFSASRHLSLARSSFAYFSLPGYQDNL